jgi:hypothetical protein
MSDLHITYRHRGINLLNITLFREDFSCLLAQDFNLILSNDLTLPQLLDLSYRKSNALASYTTHVVISDHPYLSRSLLPMTFCKVIGPKIDG